MIPITPEKVVLELFPPEVKYTVAATEFFMVPAPAIEPTSKLLPLRSNEPVTVIALLAIGPKVAVADPILMVPAEIVVVLV